MNDDKYANSGFLYPKEQKGKGPNHSGSILISRDLLRWMVEQSKAGNEVTIELASWEKTSKKGQPYQSLLASKPWVKTETKERDDPASRLAPRNNTEEDEDVPF